MRVLTGDTYNNEFNADGSIATPPPFDVYVANSGSVNVRGVIPSNLIDSIVIDVAWVAKIGEHARTAFWPKGLVRRAVYIPCGNRGSRVEFVPRGSLGRRVEVLPRALLIPQPNV